MNQYQSQVKRDECLRTEFGSDQYILPQTYSYLLYSLFKVKAARILFWSRRNCHGR